MNSDIVFDIVLLAVGIISGGLSVYFIKKEPRRILNGILVMVFLVCTIIGGVGLSGPNQQLPDGSIMLGSGSQILSIIVIFILALSFLGGIALCVNGIKLIRKEHLSLSHSLPLFFGMAAILWPVLLVMMVIETLNFPILNNVSRFVFLIMLYVPGMLAAFLIYSVIYALLPKNKHCDFILILGAGLSRGRAVSPLLKGRLNKAIQLFTKNGNHSTFIVSGGQGDDELLSEADAMKRYLLICGVPENKIIVEDQSTNTRENMLLSKAIMSNIKKDYTCLFVTSNYHVLRAAILAKSVGLNAQGIGGRTASYYLPAAFIREYLAIVFQYKKLAIIYVLVALLIDLIATKI